MRSAPLLGALALLLPARPALAQRPPDLRVVIQPGAEVRAGPSLDPHLYPTNRLERGQTVEVVEERPDGWLAIRPPDGSFSWINTRFLEHIVPNPPNWVVAMERVRVPVMVLASENDPRCPIRQIDNYLARLEELGKPHEVYRFDAGHGSLVIEETIRQVEVALSFALRTVPSSASGLHPRPGAVPGRR